MNPISRILSPKAHPSKRRAWGCLSVWLTHRRTPSSILVGSGSDVSVTSSCALTQVHLQSIASLRHMKQIGHSSGSSIPIKLCGPRSLAWRLSQTHILSTTSHGQVQSHSQQRDQRHGQLLQHTAAVCLILGSMLTCCFILMNSHLVVILMNSHLVVMIVQEISPAMRRAAGRLVNCLCMLFCLSPFRQGLQASLEAL